MQDIPVYTEDTVKGDRFIKDCQHVHFIYDGVELISKSRNEARETYVLN